MDSFLIYLPSCLSGVFFFVLFCWYLGILALLLFLLFLIKNILFSSQISPLAVDSYCFKKTLETKMNARCDIMLTGYSQHQVSAPLLEEDGDGIFPPLGETMEKADERHPTPTQTVAHCVGGNMRRNIVSCKCMSAKPTHAPTHTNGRVCAVSSAETPHQHGSHRCFPGDVLVSPLEKR